MKSTAKRPERFSNEELLALVLFLSTVLDETVDAVCLAAFDKSFPTHRQMTELINMQLTVCDIAEAAANALLESDAV